MLDGLLAPQEVDQTSELLLMWRQDQDADQPREAGGGGGDMKVEDAHEV